MSRQFCPECGHENQAEARFCMNCGHALAGEVSPASADKARGTGTDWLGIVAAILAFLSLRHMSRKAWQTTIVIAFLVIFFGCPMVCSFAMFGVDSVLKLFQ